MVLCRSRLTAGGSSSPESADGGVAGSSTGLAVTAGLSMLGIASRVAKGPGEALHGLGESPVGRLVEFLLRLLDELPDSGFGLLGQKLDQGVLLNVHRSGSRGWLVSPHATLPNARDRRGLQVALKFFLNVFAMFDQERPG
jgi:hypothetical protein